MAERRSLGTLLLALCAIVALGALVTGMAEMALGHTQKVRSRVTITPNTEEGRMEVRVTSRNRKCLGNRQVEMTNEDGVLVFANRTNRQGVVSAPQPSEGTYSLVVEKKQLGRKTSAHNHFCRPVRKQLVVPAA